MKIPASQIAVTLYNLRDYCQTESDLDRTLAKVRAIGYEAVQVSAVPLEAAVIKRALDKNGLFCCATHEGLGALEQDTEAVLDKLDVLECDFSALGAPPVEYRASVEGLDKLCSIMNRAGEAFAKRGKVLGYHNHQFEFQRLPGRRETAFEYFYDHTDPHLVESELDVHWVTRGGGSPAAWIEKLGNRLHKVIHFKDFTILDGETPVYCEVGEGNLDWPGILAACRKVGVRFYSIEQDMPFKDRDIFDSIAISFANLRKLGVN
ncbi:MAG: sugar phosphate isomerase/epimerase [Victivallaceae bacterium]|nr:sugar phosphate isomerase/epimerase [Victivallaceae bacterium]